MKVLWQTAGKCSTFGGPKDTGVSPSEGLALIAPRHLADPSMWKLFLPEAPPGTTGLARRLDPDALYLACRWPYRALAPSTGAAKALLRRSLCRVSRPHVAPVLCRPVDWGPAAWTGRVADLSPGAAARLKVGTDDEVTVELLG